MALSQKPLIGGYRGIKPASENMKAGISRNHRWRKNGHQQQKYLQRKGRRRRKKMKAPAVAAETGESNNENGSNIETKS